MASWPLHEAKAKLSEVVDRAMNEGRQRITRHGRPAVVVIAESELAQLEQPKPKMSFGEFLFTAPRAPDDLDIDELFAPLPSAPLRDLDFLFEGEDEEKF